MTYHPKLGAAMRLEHLPTYRDWLISDQRDLEIQDPIWVNIFDGDWKATTREISSLLDGYTGRLGIHGPFVGLTLLAHDPKIRAVVVERLTQGLAFAADIGATHMVVHSPFQSLGTPLLVNSPDMGRGDQIKTIQDTLADVLPIAEQANCTLMIENIHDRNPGLLVALVRSFDSPHVRMSLDTGHAYINHKLGAPPPDHFAREAGALLGHVHLQDTDGVSDRHWVPGEGDIKWHGLFRALRNTEANPRLILELADYSAIPRAVAWFEGQGLAD